MKIVVLSPKNEFTKEQVKRLEELGEAVFTSSRKRYSLPALIKMARGADILATDPDNVGGFEKGKETLRKVMETLPNLKGLCLSTTSYGWADLSYCAKRGIRVCNIPGYSRESVAEHSFALLLCLAKRILVTDRKTQKGKYSLEKGFELAGKILGIVGLGNIGSRVAELGLGFGMKVIAYSRNIKQQNGVEMKSLKEVLKESDAISLNLKDCRQTEGIIGAKELKMSKKGMIMVNTADRALVDENAMAKYLKSGKVYGYAFEGEDIENGPLAKIENAIGLKGFGWYTKEALENLFEIWVENIICLTKGKPQNRVV